MARSSDRLSSASSRSRSRLRSKYKTYDFGRYSLPDKKIVLSGSVTGCAITSKECKPGRITRNPFLNFLREFRLNLIDAGMNVCDIARAGGALWRKMDRTEKEPYFKQASSVPKETVKRKRRCSRCGKKKRPSSKSCGKKRQAASRSGGKKLKRVRIKCGKKMNKSGRKGSPCY